MNQSYQIKIIGTGNTATVLGRLLIAHGFTIQSLTGRNPVAASQLAKEWNCVICATEDIRDDGGICLICVSDNAIATVAAGLHLEQTAVVHTAGAVDISILPFKNTGILYPLQSLRKERDKLPQIPFLIEASNQHAETMIVNLASAISGIVMKTNFQERLRMHLAAVFVSNFTNHLYAIAHDFCIATHLDYKVLGPLIQEVAERATTTNPHSMQTGPAIRGDEQTIQMHEKLLVDFPQWLQMYQMMTESIKNQA